MAKGDGYQLTIQDSNSKPAQSISKVFVAAAIVVLVAGLALLIAGIVAVSKKSCQSSFLSSPKNESCEYSAEARRVDLQGFLSRLKDAYYQYNPNSAAWKPDLVGMELTEHVMQR